MKTFKSKHEFADVLKDYKGDFLKRHKTTNQVLKTFNAIEICRTKALGGHIQQCRECDHSQISYNSCRNRHCPKCQAISREKWIAKRESELLKVPYFHLVFTLPHEFNSLVLEHPKQVYDALFKASWQTINAFAFDHKHLGAKPAMTAVLHTWGQNLSLHPHLHCIVPGGGLSSKGKWVSPKKASKGRHAKYLFPKRALSKVFRAKFMAELRTDLVIPQDVAKQVMSKNWVVYAKQPFLGAKQVIEYLGRYTHKIAISNHRIKDVENGKVTFSYKDYRHSGIKKTMTLEAHEFIRRYALHVLPHGFRRMRHYGFLASRNKKTELNIAKSYFNQSPWMNQKLDWKNVAKEKLNFNPDQCPKCQKESFRITQVFEAVREPPSITPLPKITLKNAF